MNRVGIALAIALPTLAGCSPAKPRPADPTALEPVVRVVNPQPRTIVRMVAQPGVIEPYEQTAIYTKVSGYVRKWHVDVGDRVKKGDLLAELEVPELVEELKQKRAQVGLERAAVEQARKQQEIAERMLQAADEEINEAKAAVRRYAAEVKLRQIQVQRIGSLARDSAVTPELLDETKQQLESSQAAREGAAATVKTKEAHRLTAAAGVRKAAADVLAAEAKVRVAEADVFRVEALVRYTSVTAPYEGVITARNVSTGDFVRPATGDPSAGRLGTDTSTAGATPLYVLARTDRVMFVVGIPELDSEFVGPGSRAMVRIQALGNEEKQATVCRISRRLDNRSRTLQAQLDLPNPDGKLLPGMYAYGAVAIERKGVRAVPSSAVVEAGEQAFCYLLVGGKAVRTAVQTGVSDGEWVEVRRKKVPSSGDAGEWAEFTGKEEVIVGDLSELTNGSPVRVDAGT